MKMTIKRIWTLLAAMLLCLTPVIGALADGVVADMFEIGRELMFATENVTITGNATFALEDEAFREAKIEYRQDGENSFYDLTLVNPKNGVINGYTIIANSEDIYVMEKYTQGFYRSGTSEAQSTLVRRTSLLENILNMAELLGGQMELALGDAISVSEGAEGKTVRIVLDSAQASGLIDTGLNLVAEYITQRYFETAYFDRGYDEKGRYPLDRASYISTAAYLLDTTKYYVLDDLDVSFAIDSENRFTGVTGKATLHAVGYDGVPRKLDITLDLALTDYGSTHVGMFDPADYNVVPYAEWLENTYGNDYWLTDEDEAVLSYYHHRAITLGQICDFRVDETTNSSTSCYDDFAEVLLEDDATGEAVFFEFTQSDDRLLSMQDMNAPWSNAELQKAEGLDEVMPECINCAFSFLNMEHPNADQVKLVCEGMYTPEEGVVYLLFEDLSVDNYVYMIVQAQPYVRVVYYNCTVG